MKTQKMERKTNFLLAHPNVDIFSNLVCTVWVRSGLKMEIYIKANLGMAYFRVTAS